jgi:D-aspartate ligase
VNPTVDVDTSTSVVVFRAESYCSLGIVRSLGRLGVKVYCVDHEPDALAFKSRYCAGRFEWNFESSSGGDSVQRLLHVAREIGGKPVLVPTFDTRSLFVDSYCDELAKAFLLPSPGAGAVSRLYSKRSMYELCMDVDVATPQSVFPLSVDEAMTEGARLRFPVVVKAIDGDRLMHRTGRRLAIARTPSELRDVYCSLDEPGSNNLMLQEYIPGTTDDAWILSAYFDAKGECRFALTGRKLRQLPVDGGVTTYGVCTPCDPMVESIRRVAGAAGYRGIIDACFRFDSRTNSWNLLDVNPRAGANFRLFVDRNGLDVVRALYLDLTGQLVPDVDPNWGRTWLVEDRDIAAMREGRRAGSVSLGRWVNTVCGASEFAYLAADDLWPAFATGSTLARGLFCRRLRSLRRLGFLRI